MAIKIIFFTIGIELFLYCLYKNEQEFYPEYDIENGYATPYWRKYE